ncbi:Hpt domain-containing protein [Enterovibrio nigricans]|uniref:Two-component system, phosphorelay protein LuxU n=1 Tax=Enterovibrio nigricans DSM 22720 TaxID=1121868 RepID=A0A1T4VL74_9GAMM|nr:Hpt domain-containing protein [Enterovibrio nigricans]PKF49435.1 Hpt domain-containing protein [Enterovibrio nigricans]SKA65679.1 two-component system, phosphorelay protein LuxU [Enterovibrio nigricans DSM 22720]
MASTVNHETLRRLAVEVGEETVSSLLIVFSDELSRYSDQLTDAPSPLKVREISHAIKSSAASFGADELAELARECESRVKLGQDSWVHDQLPRLTTMLQGTASEYKALAGQQDLFNSQR